MPAWVDTAPRLRRQLLRVERIISPLPVEHGFAFTPPGKFLFHRTIGSSSSIRLLPEQERQLRNAVFTHNHPDARSISERDLELAIHFGLRQIRAVTRWARYWIDPHPHGWPSIRQVSSAIEEEGEMVLYRLRSDIERKVLTSEDADCMYEHMLWRKLSDRGLIRYGVEFWHLGVVS